MSSLHLRDLGILSNQPEERTGLSRTRRSVQQRPQTRGLDRHGSSTSAPPTPQRSVPMEDEKKRFRLDSYWEELGASCQKICLREIYFKDLIEITKVWNPKRQLKRLEEREAKIRENKATIQDIEEKWRQKEYIPTN
ncbi:hypothetical protein O181_029560 [Austropuccinia psidii MF-1]|uniref:Uncharacterized protein n=1 Tax=Austropuccinia psidii MF-1 TaxID=1389203 RepID=A0A9Q3CVF4_9BASI|nr:hypothetical protein [Austropuccinia psidii MF-1]